MTRCTKNVPAPYGRAIPSGTQRVNSNADIIDEVGIQTGMRRKCRRDRGPGYAVLHIIPASGRIAPSGRISNCVHHASPEGITARPIQETDRLPSIQSLHFIELAVARACEQEPIPSTPCPNFWKCRWLPRTSNMATLVDEVNVVPSVARLVLPLKRIGDPATPAKLVPRVMVLVTGYIPYRSRQRPPAEDLWRRAGC